MHQKLFSLVVIVNLFLGNHASTYAQERRVADSLNNSHIKLSSLILPVTLMTYGVVSIENDGLKKLDHTTMGEIREDHPKFVTHVDNYLMFSPAIAVYALNIAGIKGKTTFATDR